MEKTLNPWSVPVAVENIPETGLHLEFEAPPTVRRALVGLAALRELPQLSAVFDLTRRGTRVRVVGQVRAQVGQTCVVTLEPIENEVDETIDLIFAPVPAEVAQAETRDTKANEEPPEPLVDGRLDLGAIATEFLLLGIDPYPRKAGAEFTPLKADSGGTRPFAALEALKKRLGGS